MTFLQVYYLKIVFQYWISILNSMTMNDQKILILCDKISPEELRNLIEPHFASNEEISIVLEKEPEGARPISPVVLAALIALVGVGITALVNVLIETLKAVKEFENSSITIKAKNGREITFPMNTSKEKIKEMLQVMQQLEVEELIIE